jgi:hypothetical protein
VRIRYKGRERTLNLYPDAIFGVKPEGRKKPSFFCLEADRGTEPGVRRNLLRSSLYKKFLLYYTSWAQWAEKDLTGEHRVVPPYGFKNPRVLTVVWTKKDPEARIDNLMGVAQEVAPNAPGLFLFTTHRALVADDPLTHEWRNAKGEVVRLLR